MCNKIICQISRTPLVGAPANITRAINSYSDWSAELYIEENYKGVRESYFNAEARSVDFSDDLSKSALIRSLEKADVILIHNDISIEMSEMIQIYSNDTPLLYLTHSPQREGPLFCDVENSLGLKFAKKLCCAQYHWGIYPEYTPVPLIVNYVPSLNLYEPGEKIRILYLPSHRNSSGRWNSKTSDLFLEEVSKIQRYPIIELIAPDNPLKPNDLYALRQTCHITIDEVITGTFHTISLEGLCAGNIVINASTRVSNLALEITTKNKNDKVPFLYCDEEQVYNLLVEMIQDPLLIRNRQKESYDYYCKNLQPKDLIKNYINVFDEVIR